MTEIENTFIYRPFVKKLYWSLIVTLVFSELVVLRLNIFEIMAQDWLGAIVKITVVSTLVLSIFFRVWVFIRPRVFSIYALTPEGLCISFKKNQKEFSFSQIKKVKFTRLPPRFGGGYSLTLNTGQTFMFSTMLEGSNLILDQITTQRPDLMDEKKLQDFKRKVEWLPLSWRRLQRSIQNIPLFIAKAFLWPLVLSIYLSQHFEKLGFLKSYLVAILLCGFLQMGLHFVENGFFIFCLEKYKNLKEGSKFDRYFSWGFSGLYVIFSLLMLVVMVKVESYFQ